VTSAMAAFMTEQIVAQESDFANVKIVVFDTFGNPIQRAAVKLSSVVPGEIFTATGRDVVFKQVPFGVYDLELRVGFPYKEGANWDQPAKRSFSDRSSSGQHVLRAETRACRLY